jgi:hypothetical protein
MFGMVPPVRIIPDPNLLDPNPLDVGPNLLDVGENPLDVSDLINLGPNPTDAKVETGPPPYRSILEWLDQVQLPVVPGQ